MNIKNNFELYNIIKKMNINNNINLLYILTNNSLKFLIIIFLFKY